MISQLETTLAQFHLFGDPTRVRLVALLARHELTVAELTAVTGLAQSRVSTHLGKLREAGVLRDRRSGASTLYAVNADGMPGEARRVWALLEDGDAPVLAADRRRCEVLLRARERRADWPDAVAGQMERHYSPGRTWEATARAFLGLVRLGDVLDVGSGDGTIAQLLAPRARTLTCVDRSARVLEAARARLGTHGGGVRFVRGDMHALPLPAARFDHVLLFNVLACSRAPGRALAEAARVLRRGGGLTLVTLDVHRQLDVTQTYGHVQPGFKPAALRALLGRAGLAVEHCEVTVRERREPHFNVVTAFARKDG